MSFLLGSFASGMFGGAQSVMNLYGMYQDQQQRQLGLDAARDLKAARADGATPSPQDVTGGAIPLARPADPQPAGGTAGDPDTLPHPTSSQPAPTRADPVRSGAVQAGARILHGMGRGDIDRSSQVPDAAPPPAVTPTGALGRAVPPPAPIAPDPPAVNPAQGAAGMINPADPDAARRAIGIGTSSALPAPSPAQAPAPAAAAPQPNAAYGSMTLPQLADVSAHPERYPNITPAQARAELDARSDAQAPTPAPTPTPAAATPPALGADGQPKISPLDLSSWSKRARQNYPPAPAAVPAASAASAPVPDAGTGTGALPGAGASAPATSPTMADAGSPPSLGSRILGALGTLNPISSAQAAEPKPPGPTASPAAAPPTVAAPAQAIPASPAAPPAKEEILAGPGAPPIPQAGTPAAARAPEAQVTLPESRATRVAPNQQGPSVQSEAPPAATRPAFDPRPYASVVRKSPEVRDMIDRIAARENVDPARLAWHWHRESGLRMTAPDGSSGERGVMQMMPSTQKMLGLQHLDPSNLQDSLTMGARYIHQLDTKFGQNAPLSFAAYQGGEGSATAIANGEGERHPNSVAYMRAAFPGQVINPHDLHGAIDVDARGAVEAGTQGGPDGFLRFIAQSGPAGVPLSDKWRAAETSLMALAASKGDIDGMRHAQDFVLQMSQQGSTTSLMNAYKALNAGDGTTAAQQLARAHAFFPDGSMGRFGVDGRGQVWAQAMDEHDPSKPLGKPTQVTLQGLQGMMIQTRDPKTFLAMVTEQQKQNAELRFKQQHGDYYGELAKTRQDSLAATKQNREDNLRELQYKHDQDKQIADDKRAVELETAKGGRGGGGGGGPDPAMLKTVDAEVTKLYGPGGTATTMDNLNPDQAGLAGQIHADLRMNQSQTGQPITNPDAYRISSGLVRGTMTIVPNKAAPGTYGVFRRGQTGGAPEAVITGATASRLINHMQPNGGGGGQQAIPTQGASANPYAPRLPMAQRSALPVATPAPNAPSTTTVQ